MDTSGTESHGVSEPSDLIPPHGRSGQPAKQNNSPNRSSHCDNPRSLPPPSDAPSWVCRWPDARGQTSYSCWSVLPHIEPPVPSLMGGGRGMEDNIPKAPCDELMEETEGTDYTLGVCSPIERAPPPDSGVGHGAFKTTSEKRSRGAALLKTAVDGGQGGAVSKVLTTEDKIKKRTYGLGGHMPAIPHPAGAPGLSTDAQRSKFSIRDNPGSQFFTVTMTALTVRDSGLYFCGIAESRRTIIIVRNFRLVVSKGWENDINPLDSMIMESLITPRTNEPWAM
ncbi:hypothetical protein A6R68_05794 [Neotoma lepida]|uniref:Immunoglobulin V-set domain-containing protein n=1 Tax=Neotoma lepida TaxID=56216 RepID=A0A1A6GH82_NEOLE|nr:hypothetical protein A6R68_05794 [Neotoma lepida]